MYSGRSKNHEDDFDVGHLERFAKAPSVNEDTVLERLAQRDPPALLTFYEAQQLGLFVYEQRDALTEQENAHQQPPRSSTTTSSPACYLHAVGSELAVLLGCHYNARRVNWTAEDEQRDRLHKQRDEKQRRRGMRAARWGRDGAQERRVDGWMDARCEPQQPACGTRRFRFISTDWCACEARPLG